MASACVDISRREVIQALMIALMVVVANERSDLVFKVTGQEVVLQQDAVLERLMPTFEVRAYAAFGQGLSNLPLTARIKKGQPNEWLPEGGDKLS